MTRWSQLNRLHALRFVLALTLLMSNLTILARPEIASAAGASYYVSTTGSDTSVGSEAAPFKTISKAAQVAAAGDTVYVKAGTYAERVTFSKSGTSGSPIAFRAFGSDLVRFTDGFSVTGSYITVDGFDVSEGAASPAVSISGSYNVVNRLNVHDIGQAAHVERNGIRVGGTHNLLSNSYAGFCSGYCIDLGGTYNTVSGSTFEQGECKPWITTYNSTTWYANWDSYGMQMGGSYNTFDDCVSIRPWYGGLYQAGTNNTIRVEFRDNHHPDNWSGIEGPNHRCCVMEKAAAARNNVYDGCEFGTTSSAAYIMQGCGFEFDNDTGTGGLASFIIRNSIFHPNEAGYNGGGILAQLMSVAPTSKCYIYNNVFHSRAVYTGDNDSHFGTGSLVFRNNIFLGGGGNSTPFTVADVGPNAAIYDHDYNFYSSSVYTSDFSEAHGAVGSTGFVSSADYHLTASSAAIGKGIGPSADGNVPTTDKAGATRSGATSDMGIYVSGGTIPPADTTAPTVSLSAPANGATVSGSVALAATAADNVGVARVEFSVDGVLVGTDTSSPYAATWSATGAALGSHTIVAKAYDAAGNSSTSSAAVSVVAPPADTTASDRLAERPGQRRHGLGLGRHSRHRR